MKLKYLVALAALAFSTQALSHGHHSHGVPLTEKEVKASNGVFEDSDVKDRKLSDWDGVWQSIYPYAKDGSLDPVFRKKAASGKSGSFEEIKAYYLKGYATEVSDIGIENGVMEFTENGKTSACQYDYKGFKILKYVSGKRGVRYLFECTDAKSAAPKYVQFSDHTIAPRKSAHFHIYTGNVSQEALLAELENWPTYFPFQLTKEQVVDDLLHH